MATMRASVVKGGARCAATQRAGKGPLHSRRSRSCLRAPRAAPDGPLESLEALSTELSSKAPSLPDLSGVRETAAEQVGGLSAVLPAPLLGAAAALALLVPLGVAGKSWKAAVGGEASEAAQRAALALEDVKALREELAVLANTLAEQTAGQLEYTESQMSFVNETRAQFASLEEQVAASATASDVEQLKSALRGKQEEARLLGEALRARDLGEKALRKEVSALQTALGERASGEEALRREVAALQSSLDERASGEEALREEVSALRLAFETRAGGEENLRKEVAALRLSLDERASGDEALREELGQLRGAVKEKFRGEEALRKELSAVKTAQKEQAARRDEIDGLKSLLREAQGPRPRRDMDAFPSDLDSFPVTPAAMRGKPPPSLPETARRKAAKKRGKKERNSESLSTNQN